MNRSVGLRTNRPSIPTSCSRRHWAHVSAGDCGPTATCARARARPAGPSRTLNCSKSLSGPPSRRLPATPAGGRKRHGRRELTTTAIVIRPHRERTHERDVGGRPGTEDYEDIGEGAYDSEDDRGGPTTARARGGTYEGYGEDAEDRDSGRPRSAAAADHARAAAAGAAAPPAASAEARQRAGRSAPARAMRRSVPAIRSLDLETKVGLDSLRRRLDESNRRANRNAWAAVASAAASRSWTRSKMASSPMTGRQALIRAPRSSCSHPGRRRPGIEGIREPTRESSAVRCSPASALLGNFRNKPRACSTIIDHSPGRLSCC